MALYRHALPQLSGEVFLTDGGIETTLVFHDGIDLPFFAAFPLTAEEAGRDALRRYFQPYIATAKEHGVGFILDTPTWRANADWGAKLGHSAAALAEFNRGAVATAIATRDAEATPRTPFVINGCIGPRGDGYKPEATMTADEAARYHHPQIESFRDGGADMVTALTMNYVEEAIGVVRAAQACGMPAVISFTVETDGKLPTGETLRSAIERTDQSTSGAPAYYMINCAHPAHFQEALTDGPWLDRIRGLRANASTKSHAELDAATELDAGDPAALARDYLALRQPLKRLSILGGCCGTDHRHVRAICECFQ